MKSLVIELEDALDVNEGTAKGSGKQYKIIKQIGHFFNGSKYPTACKVGLQRETEKLPSGIYEVDFAKATYVDKYGNLALNVNRDCLTLAKAS